LLVWNGSWFGTKVQEFAGEIEANQALEAVAQAKRRRGYRDL
jgi:predicted DNA-binding WGR domain protein